MRLEEPICAYIANDLTYLTYICLVAPGGNGTQTDANGPYEWQSFEDFDGPCGHRVTATTSTVVGIWLGKLARALLLSSFVVVALAGNLYW